MSTCPNLFKIKFLIPNKNMTLLDLGFSHHDYDEYSLLGCSTVQSPTSPPMFQKNISSPSSSSKCKPSKKPVRSRLQAALCFFLVNTSNLKMEAVRFSETSVYIGLHALHPRRQHSARMLQLSCFMSDILNVSVLC
jgi:hypothetical protein